MSTLLRNVMLGGSMFQPLWDAEGVAGGGAAAGAAAGGDVKPGAAAGGADGAGAGAGGAAGAAAGAAGGAGAGGAAAGGGGAAGGDAAGAGAAAGGEAAGKGTIAAGGAAAPAITAQAKWPDNWRQEMAGDDKAYLKILERYDSPAAVAKSHRELATKVSAGELKGPAKPMPANATPEQLTAWRAEQGLPATADAYVGALKLPDGIVAGDADKPMLSAFAKAAHEAGKSQGEFDFATSFYFQMQEQQQAERIKADGTFKNSSLVELGQEMGKDFEGNINAIAGVIALLPEAIRDPLLTARLPSGNLVGDDPNFNRAMLMLAKTINPAASILPSIGGGGLSNVESRIAEIETKHMRAAQGSPDWHAYYQGDAGAKMQQEYRDLVGARETMKKRNAA